MHNKAYQLFLDSMVVEFNQWHDGRGYDLEVLGRLGSEERASIEERLVENLKQAGDWRDVEVLAALGTVSARTAVDMARFHNNTQVRNYALKIILDNRIFKDTTKKNITELEEQVVQTVAHGDHEYDPVLFRARIDH